MKQSIFLNRLCVLSEGKAFVLPRFHVVFTGNDWWHSSQNRQGYSNHDYRQQRIETEQGEDQSRLRTGEETKCWSRVWIKSIFKTDKRIWHGEFLHCATSDNCVTAFIHCSQVCAIRSRAKWWYVNIVLDVAGLQDTKQDWFCHFGYLEEGYRGLHNIF